MECAEELVTPEVVDVYRPVEGAGQVHAHVFRDVDVGDHSLVVAVVLTHLPVSLIAKRARRCGHVLPYYHITVLASTDKGSLIGCRSHSSDCALMHIETRKRLTSETFDRAYDYLSSPYASTQDTFLAVHDQHREVKPLQRAVLDVQSIEACAIIELALFVLAAGEGSVRVELVSFRQPKEVSH